jgi:subtilisin family serine protease
LESGNSKPTTPQPAVKNPTGQSSTQSANSGGNKPDVSKANQAAKALKKDNEKQSAACTGSSAAKDPCSDFIVVFNPASSRATANSLIARANGRVKREFNQLFNGAVVNGPLSKMQALANNPNFLVVEDDLEVTTSEIQSKAPWGLDRIDQRLLPLNTNFDYLNNTGNGTSIFVVDTGIDATNIDFGGRVQPGFTAIADGKGSADCNGHGTHVAGIAGGSIYGVAKNAQLVPVRVLGCDGSGSYSNVISGLEYVASQYSAGAKFVVNMSLGGPSSSTIDGAVQTLIAKGVHVVVAAGNSSANACNYSPARVPEAITVGATTTSDSMAGYSNFGSCLDLFAPGTSITSTWLGASGVNTISGTSMAAPAVAGVVARFISANATLTPAQVSNSVKSGATKALLTGIGSGSPNSLAYTEFQPDLTTPTTTVTPTFKRVNPVGKSVGKSTEKNSESSATNPAGKAPGKAPGKG